jgi:probable rRNA maturation factor
MFFNQTSEDLASEIKYLQALINKVVTHETNDKLAFSIVLVTKDRIRAINKQYRKLDKETDVLSFRLEDSKVNYYQGKRLLGDVFISLDKAKEQAQLLKKPLVKELFFLMVHGFLHLLGYNDEMTKDIKIMNKKQEDILNEYGCTQ